MTLFVGGQLLIAVLLCPSRSTSILRLSLTMVRIRSSELLSLELDLMTLNRRLQIKGRVPWLSMQRDSRFSVKV